MAGMFYIGAAYSCNNSQGELMGGLNLMALQCYNIDITKVCEYAGNYYIPDNLTENILF